MERLLPPRAWMPCAVTAANIAVGFASMLAAVEGKLDLAVRLLLACIFLDMADGRLARGLRATSRFGMELDSLSDALSFGAAPAFLAWQATLRPLGSLGAAVAVVYLMAGIYRLARYNVLSDAHGKGRRTLGVPIPIGASYLMALVLMRDAVPAFAAAALVLVMAALLVSRLALPELSGRSLTSGMLLVGIANYVAVVFAPGWATIAWWNAWNAAILLAAWREDHESRQPEAAV